MKLLVVIFIHAEMISAGSNNWQDSAVVSEQDGHLEPWFSTPSKHMRFVAAQLKTSSY